MPEYTHTGHTGHDYPEHKDASGGYLGTVRPGDIRDLGMPPDHLWRETTDEDRAALAERAAAAAGQPEGRTGEGSGDPGAEKLPARAPKARLKPPDLPVTVPDSGSKEG
jgi:hypothetical protein